MKFFGCLMSWLLLAACAAVSPRTTIESTWEDPTYVDGGFNRIAVLATFRTESESRNFEDAVVTELEQRGITAIPGRAFLDNGGRYSEQEMEQRLRDIDAEGALVFRLIAVDEDLTCEPPLPYLTNMPPGFIVGNPYYWYYRPHWNLYSYWRSSLDVTRSQGYWRRHRYVVVETSLYDNATDQLVWTAKSETMEPDDYARLGTSIAHTVSERLVERELLDPSQLLASGA